MAQARWAVVATARDRWELQLLSGLLSGAGLPVRVETTGLAGTAGLFGGAEVGPGQYHLLVPESQAGTALALLAAEPQTEA